jgi:pimeloyl-ACP methyl ester carboxylesterase
MLHELMAPYADERPLLIGHSLGGLYAAQMALEAPGRYRGVVLINPGGFLLPDSAPRGREFRDFLATGEAHAILNRVFHKPPRHLRLVAKGLQAQMRSPVILDFLDAMPASEMITAEQVARLPADGLLFCGQEDHFLPAGTLQAWAAHFPGTVQWLARSAHASQVECAGIIAGRIRAALPGFADRAHLVPQV